MMKSKLQHLLLILILGLVVSLWQGPQVQAAPESGPMSFLFLGIDTGELGRTEQGRSDTIMVMTLNPSHKTLRLVSLPETLMSILRATRVWINLTTPMPMVGQSSLS